MTSPFRPDALQGKVAIVTGGGSGICYEITKQLLLHGCRGAIICGRRENFLKDAASNLSNLVGNSSNSSNSGHSGNSSNSNGPHNPTCLYRVCDVRDPNACHSVVEYAVSNFGRVDILVNGAAGNFLADAKSLSPKGFKTVMDIDALGTFNMCHAVYPAMANDGKGGTIINISMTLHYGATLYQAHASAAKSAVDSLTRSLALEWGCDDIRVNGIAPGPIADTPGTEKLTLGISVESIEDMIPLGRLGTKFDIGMAAVFLCSDGGAGYVSGATLVVDGGEWLYKSPPNDVPKGSVGEMSRKVEAKSRAMRPDIVSKL